MGGAIVSRPSIRDGLRPEDPVPDVEQNDYAAAVKSFAVGTAWAVGFDAVHRSIPFLCQRMGWWKRLPDSRSRYEARAYLTSVIHHGIAVPFSIWSLWRDTVNAGARDLDYGPHRAMLAFSSGFFLADTWFARKDLLKSWDYSIHHIFALALTWQAAAARGGSRFLSHFLVGEVTTLLLDLLWFLRKTGAEDTPLFKASGAAFTLLYAVLRVYWFPYFTHALLTKHTRVWDALGPVAWATVGVSGLQVWWYYRILLKFEPIFREALGLKPRARAAAVTEALPAA